MAVVEKNIDGFTLHVKDFVVKQLDANISKSSGWKFDTEAASIEAATISKNNSSGSDYNRFNSPSEGYVISTTMNNVVVDTKPPEKLPIDLDDADMVNIVFPVDSTYEGATFPPEGFKFSVKITDELGMDGQAVDFYYKDELKYQIRNGNVVKNDWKDSKNSQIIKTIAIDCHEINTATITLTFKTNTKEVTELLNSGDCKLYCYDMAGNKVRFDLDEIDWIFMPLSIEDFMETCQRVEFTYENTRPKNLQLKEAEVGSTCIETYNPNWCITSKSFIIVSNLADDSLGFLERPKAEKAVEYEAIYNNFNRTKKILDKPESYERNHYSERKVQSIQNCGDVSCFGYVTPIHWKQPAAGIIRKLTYNTSKLGEWITEAASNVRKLEADTYVPEVTQGTSYQRFANFFKWYLDTMYTDFNTGNKIGVLEKISRISDFNDTDLIERKYLNDYANQHGFPLKMDLDILKETLRFVNNFSKTTTVNNIDEELTMRNVYHNLPYVIKTKGTFASLKMLYGFLGLDLGEIESTNESNSIRKLNLYFVINENSFHDLGEESKKPDTDIDNISKIYEFLKDYGNAILPTNKLIDKIVLTYYRQEPDPNDPDKIFTRLRKTK